MATYDLSSERSRLRELIDGSPESEVRTSKAAGAALLLGVAATLSAPFSLMLAVSLALAVPGAVSGVVGIAASSRSHIAGSAIAATGLVCCLGALALVGLRYAGLDTAFADGLVPGIRDALLTLNSLLPQP